VAQATLNGELVFDGGIPCDCRFEYGETLAYGIFTPWHPGLVTGDTFFDVIYGLRDATTYFFRAVARNPLGVVNAAGASVLTPVVPPIIATVAATGISTHYATLNYYVVNDTGFPCIVWFEYGATIAYGMESSKEPGQESYDTGGIIVSGLAAGTYFHYRAVIQNQNGVGYGEDMVFTTLSLLSPMSGISMEQILMLEEVK